MKKNREESKPSSFDKTPLNPTYDDTGEESIDKVLSEILPPDLPKEKREAVTRLISQRVSYSGPIPPASEFGQYEAALPGSGDRIFKMAESSLEQSNKIESRSLWAEICLSGLGQVLGFVGFLSIIGAGVYLVILGHSVAGAVISVSGSLVAIVPHIIKGRSVLFGRSSSNDDAETSESKHNNNRKKRRR